MKLPARGKYHILDTDYGRQGGGGVDNTVNGGARTLQPMGRGGGDDTVEGDGRYGRRGGWRGTEAGRTEEIREIGCAAGVRDYCIVVGQLFASLYILGFYSNEPAIVQWIGLNEIHGAATEDDESRQAGVYFTLQWYFTP